jgi:hypothetical protein
MGFGFRGMRCQAGHTSIFVESDGQVYRCARYASAGTESRGNGLTGFTLNDEPSPCANEVCVSGRPHFIVATEAQKSFLRALQSYFIGRTEESIALFQASATADPRYSNPCLHLAIIHWENGEENDARMWISEAKARAPRCQEICRCHDLILDERLASGRKHNSLSDSLTLRLLPY